MSLQTPDFDHLKRENDQGQPYWSARDLSEELGYKKNWRGFEQVIKKAMAACATDNIPIIENFFEAEITIQQGRATRKISDYFLSKRACRYIAMQGNAHLPEIAAALSYFNSAIESHEMHELRHQTEQRIFLREKVAEENTHLSLTAMQSGVQRQNMGLFMDAGYNGLYAMTSDELKRFWNLKDDQHILDVMGPEHLAANLFRITATDHKLREDHILDENLAILTHYDVAREVKEAVERIHNKDTKDLPRAFDLRKELEARRRATQRRVTKEKQAEDDGQQTLF
jgi:DNA-damage-inducible protein D